MEKETFEARVLSLLEWANDRNIAQVKDPSALARRLSGSSAAWISRMELECSCIDENKLRERITVRIKTFAEMWWAAESLVNRSGVPLHVAGEIEARCPGFSSEYEVFREKHPGKKPEIDSVFHSRFRTEYWATKDRPKSARFESKAISFLSYYDNRHLRIYKYATDKNRARIKPHPCFEDWYVEALKYPLDDDPPSLHRSYYERQRLDLLEGVEDCLRTPVVQNYNLEVAFRALSLFDEPLIMTRGQRAIESFLESQAADIRQLNPKPEEVSDRKELLDSHPEEPSKAELAKRRQDFVRPHLYNHHLTAAKWADTAGYERKVAYHWMDGITKRLKPETAGKLAKVLGLQASDLDIF
jgi:hypothetical protein